MNALQKISIKTRLAIGYAVLTCALILVALLGIRGQSLTHDDLETQVNHLNVIQNLGNDVLDAANARAVSARILEASHPRHETVLMQLAQVQMHLLA